MSYKFSSMINHDALRALEEEFSVGPITINDHIGFESPRTFRLALEVQSYPREIGNCYATASEETPGYVTCYTSSFFIKPEFKDYTIKQKIQHDGLKGLDESVVIDILKEYAQMVVDEQWIDLDSIKRAHFSRELVDYLRHDLVDDLRSNGAHITEDVLSGYADESRW